MRNERFHGRHAGEGRRCEAPGCAEAGEFRAPGNRYSSFDGPGDWRWFCLDHVREFNAGYDWFEGMSAEEILAAQSPVAGWARQTRAFGTEAEVGRTPRWADFDDPLDAIGARAETIRARARARAGQQQAQSRFTSREREALEAMGLGLDIDRSGLRRRYADLVRRFHPDRNGGDRSHEARLGRVVEAYQLLKASPAFG